MVPYFAVSGKGAMATLGVIQMGTT